MMRKMALLLAALFALAAPAPAHAAAAGAPAFTVASRRVIPGAGATPLALVVEDGSPWNNLGALEAEVEKVSAIFARCGRPLGETQVLVVRWSADALARLRAEDPYKAPSQVSVMDEPQLPAGRPLGFLFSAGSVASTAKAFNRSAVEALARAHPEAARLKNTFWITADLEYRARPKDIAPSYSMAAHELAHILGDLPHIDAPYNLMSNAEVPGAKTGDLDDAQCAAIRKY
jgi:hypothetical protein